jgi:cysteine desulfurase
MGGNRARNGSCPRGRMFRRIRHVYLDNNATTPVAAEVRRRMAKVLRAHPGNPSAVYRLGRDAASVIARARAEVAAALNAEPAEIVFTSGGSEANNQVLRMLARRALPPRNRMITTPVEHSSVRTVAEELAASAGLEVTWLPVDRAGRVRPSDLAAALDDRAFLVSCMLANNELGTINPLAEITALAHERGALVHADCVQALGKIPVDVRSLGVDYATFSAHKVFGPKGVGVLYVRDGAPCHAFISGGQQENGRRAGTECTHNIAGCGIAFSRVPELLTSGETVASRRDSLRALLAAIKPDLVENSPRDSVVPNTLNVRFPGARNADLLAFLDLHGICASAGSACSAQGGKPSHVLTAIGLSEAEADESLRFSLSANTSVEDITYVADVIGRFARGEVPEITLVPPAQATEAFVDNPRNYVLDVRLDVERRIMRGMPNSHEIPFFRFHRWLDRVPRDRNVLIVCSTGVDASIVAYAMKARGFPSVAVLLGGLIAWRVAHPALYRTRAGSCITPVPR